MRQKTSRRWPCLLLGALLAAPATASAETTVPVDLQVDLLMRVMRFERGVREHGGVPAKLLLVVNPASSASTRAGAQVEKAVSRSRDAGKWLTLVKHAYSSPAALKKAIAQEGVRLVYLTPGMEGDLAAIADALAGTPAVTVHTDGDQVERGAVLGFELAAARPRIVLNLAQAQKQGLEFDADLFQVARVIK